MPAVLEVHSRAGRVAMVSRSSPSPLNRIRVVLGGAATGWAARDRKGGPPATEQPADRAIAALAANGRSVVPITRRAADCARTGAAIDLFTIGVLSTTSFSGSDC
jgi:hypothetical protein